MSIPDKAVEAAAQKAYERDNTGVAWEYEALEVLLAYRADARAMLEAAEPYLTDGLRQSLGEMCTDIDGNEYAHVGGCEGEAECPACWVADIRIRLAAHPKVKS